MSTGDLSDKRREFEKASGAPGRRVVGRLEQHVLMMMKRGVGGPSWSEAVNERRALARPLDVAFIRSLNQTKTSTQKAAEKVLRALFKLQYGVILDLLQGHRRSRSLPQSRRRGRSTMLCLCHRG